MKLQTKNLRRKVYAKFPKVQMPKFHAPSPIPVAIGSQIPGTKN